MHQQADDRHVRSVARREDDREHRAHQRDTDIKRRAGGYSTSETAPDIIRTAENPLAKSLMDFAS